MIRFYKILDSFSLIENEVVDKNINFSEIFPKEQGIICYYADLYKNSKETTAKHQKPKDKSKTKSTLPKTIEAKNSNKSHTFHFSTQDLAEPEDTKITLKQIKPKTTKAQKQNPLFQAQNPNPPSQPTSKPIQKFISPSHSQPVTETPNSEKEKFSERSQTRTGAGVLNQTEGVGYSESVGGGGFGLEGSGDGQERKQRILSSEDASQESDLLPAAKLIPTDKENDSIEEKDKILSKSDGKLGEEEEGKEEQSEEAERDRVGEGEGAGGEGGLSGGVGPEEGVRRDGDKEEEKDGEKEAESEDGEKEAESEDAEGDKHVGVKDGGVEEVESGNYHANDNDGNEDVKENDVDLKVIDDETKNNSELSNFEQSEPIKVDPPQTTTNPPPKSLIPPPQNESSIPENSIPAPTTTLTTPPTIAKPTPPTTTTPSTLSQDPAPIFPKATSPPITQSILAKSAVPEVEEQKEIFVVDTSNFYVSESWAEGEVMLVVDVVGELDVRQVAYQVGRLRGGRVLKVVFFGKYNS